MGAAVGTHTIVDGGRHRRTLITVLVVFLVLGQMLATGGGALAAGTSTTGTIAVEGLEGLLVGQPGSVALHIGVDEGTSATQPLRAVVRIIDAAGQPDDDVSITVDGTRVDADEDGRVVLPPMDRPPLTAASHPDLISPDGLSMSLELTAPDTDTRQLTARLVVSNERPAEVVRHAGTNRVETAAAVSAGAFPDGADTVWIARADEFADALSAGPAAGLAGGPILLTGHDELPDATANELVRLAPTRVVVLGGTAAIGEPVVDRVAGVVPGASVVRVSGPDRFATAAAVATDAFTAPVPVVVVATGTGFADALSGGAAAGHHGGPLLLVEGDTLPEATAAALRALRPLRIVVLGGTAAISDAVVGQLVGYASEGVTRHAGADRFGTSAAVAAAMFDPADVDSISVATGSSFPDALAGTPAAVVAGGPVLLVEQDSVPDLVAEQVDRLDVGTVAVLGGPAAISDGVAQVLGGMVRDILPDIGRFRDAATTPAMPFAAREAGSGGPGGGGAPVVVDSPTPGAPLSLRPGDRFPVTFTSTIAGRYTVSYRPAGTSTWLAFPNGTASGTAVVGSNTIRLNAPLTAGVLDLRVVVTPGTRAAPFTVELPGVITVALTFPPPLISALVEDMADQSQLIAVRPAGGLADGTRLDIDLGLAERGGAEYPLPAEVTLLNGNGTATLEVVRDEVARIVYVAGPGDRVDPPGVSPLLTFRIDGITTTDVDETHVGQFYRYDILHGVQRVFTIGDGPSLASPTVSDVPAGSGHTFQQLSFALREPLAPYERVDIDLSVSEQTVVDYADAFVFLQGGGGHGVVADHGPPPPPLGTVFIDTDADERSVVTFIAGPDGVPTVQPEGPTIELFVGGIVVQDELATTPVTFSRLATGESATTTFRTDRRDLVDLTATDLLVGTVDQAQTLTMTLDGAMPAGTSVEVVLPRVSSQIDYSTAEIDVAAGSGEATPYSYDGVTYVYYDSLGDPDGATIVLDITGIDTGPADSSQVIRASRSDGSAVRTAVFDVGSGSVLAGVELSDLPDDSPLANQRLSFVPTADLPPGETLTIDLSEAEVGLVDYADAFVELYEFGTPDPGSVVPTVVADASATLLYTTGPGGLAAGSLVEIYLSDVSTGVGTETYEARFTLSDSRRAVGTFRVAPPPGFAAVTASSLESGVDGQVQTITATLRGALGPSQSLYAYFPGAERAGGRYGGVAARVVSAHGGTARMSVYVDDYAEVSYTAGPAGVADGETIVIELRGVNTDLVDETHSLEWFRGDFGGFARAVFDIGAGSDFVGQPELGDLSVGQAAQYQFGVVGLADPLAPGETVVFDVTAAQAGGVDYTAALADFVYPTGAVEVLVDDDGTATITLVAGEEGIAAAETVYFELFGVATDTRLGTHSVPVTAPTASTTITFDVVMGHGG